MSFLFFVSLYVGLPNALHACSRPHLGNSLPTDTEDCFWDLGSDFINFGCMCLSVYVHVGWRANRVGGGAGSYGSWPILHPSSVGFKFRPIGQRHETAL